MTNEIYRTKRGFPVYADFEDRSGDNFTVQESSLATEYCVWVGSSDNRGHLTVEQAFTVRDALSGWLRDIGAEVITSGRDTEEGS